MSNLAYARPVARPSARPTVAPVRETYPRRVEIVTTRAQRKARPKAAYAVVTVVSVFLIFVAQLLLSIVVSEGAYQMQSLQSQQKELLRTEQALTENFNLLDSPQHLAASAAKLGLIPGTSRLFIDVESGAVVAAPTTADPTGCGGTCNLVANSLLKDVPLVDAAVATTTVTATGTASSPGTAAEQPSQTSIDSYVTALPAPVTH